MDSFHRALSRYNYTVALRKGIGKEIISQTDCELILSYISERKAKHTLSLGRVNKIVSHLINFRRFLQKEYKIATMDEIYQALNDLRYNNEYKQNTVHDFIAILKPFFLWLNENHHNPLPHEKIIEIEAPPIDRNTIDPSDILTIDEVLLLINSAGSIRNKAIIATLYDSGCRPSELAMIRWKDLTFENIGVKIYINDTKTRKRRYTLLLLADEYLRALKEITNVDREANVFLSRDGVPLSYKGYSKIMERAVKKSEIKKSITLKKMRTYKVSHMIKQGYSEHIIKEVIWGNPSTRMLDTYAKFGEDEIDSIVLAKVGIKKEEKEEKKIPPGPIKCIQCGTENPPKSKFCTKCGSSLIEDKCEDA